MADGELGLRATGPADDLQALYRYTVADVFGHLMFHTGGDRELSEELTGQTFLHATALFAEGRGSEVSVAWLKTVARRRFVDHVRRQSRVRRRAERLRNELASAQLGREPEFDTRDRVNAALDSLPAEQRLALILKHIDGLGVAEIAEVVGRSYKATESLLSRARAGFRSSYTGGSDA